ncbi:hypothetical protein KJ657_01535 [Patescibacteria group bacterium]|nr:hypothetical protein [Patescibacteria group bacterium]MBU1015751.1 hypothetical protein [Patescibacteria group bacterium]MBU1685513.1 hypothetical protein [Patescibacteria group bacterium]MBU1938701.1 hypothetical protein [Patescibacteria group bacterium]
MNHIFLAGLTGALTLVLGAAWPEEEGKPVHSTKNWLFTFGALLMLGYAILNFLFAGGSFFFILLQLMVIVASALMMLDVSDRVDTIVMTLAGLAFVAWSLLIYEDVNSLFFVIGLVGISLGYAFGMGTIKRFFALTAGSVFLTVFSYLAKDAIFLILNFFFAVFSAYYLVKVVRRA